MPLPNTTQYRLALQHPASALPWAPGVNVVRGANGQPLMHTGNFAAAFHLRKGPSEWSLRCFHREVPNLATRMQAYAGFQAAAPSELKRSLLPVAYRTEGVHVDGLVHPIVTLPWVQGQKLRNWVEAHRCDAAALRRANDALGRLCWLMAEAGAVHGDLQAGNILMRPDGSLVLVDYDSFTFQGGALRSPGNGGHRAFQHPGYDCNRHGPFADRMPLLVMHIALEALARAPSLWERFGAEGEGLLFEATDLRSPVASPLLAALVAEAAMAPWVGWLTELLRGNPDQVPGLPKLLIPARALPHGQEALVRLAARRSEPQPPPMGPATSQPAAPVASKSPAPPPFSPRQTVQPTHTSGSALGPVAALLLVIGGGCTARWGIRSVKAWWQAPKACSTTTCEPITAPKDFGRRYTQLVELRKSLRTALAADPRSHRNTEAVLRAFDAEISRKGLDAPDLMQRLGGIPEAPEGWLNKVRW